MELSNSYVCSDGAITDCTSSFMHYIVLIDFFNQLLQDLDDLDNE